MLWGVRNVLNKQQEQYEFKMNVKFHTEDISHNIKISLLLCLIGHVPLPVCLTSAMLAGDPLGSVDQACSAI